MVKTASSVFEKERNRDGVFIINVKKLFKIVFLLYILMRHIFLKRLVSIAW